MSTTRSPVWRTHDEPSEKKPSRVRALLDKARADPKTTVTFAGLVLYGVLWSAYAIFYEAFGLTPSDLGFGYLDLLAQTAVGTVGLTLVVGAVVSIYIVVLPVLRSMFRSEPHQPAPRARAKPSPRQRLAGTLAVAGCLVYLWALVVGGGVAHVVALYATYCMIGLVWIAAFAQWLKELDAGGREQLQRHLAVGMVLAFLVVAAAVLAEAAGDAQAVRQGRSAQPTALGFRLGSWGAERATIRWIAAVDADTRRVLAAPCLMYLGTSGGTAYLYAPRTKETLRLPAAQVAIATRDVTTPCVP